MQTWQRFGAPGAFRPVRCVVVQALPRAARSSRAQRWLAGGGASISGAGCSERRVPRTPGGLGGCWSHSRAGCTTALGSVSWHVPRGAPCLRQGHVSPAPAPGAGAGLFFGGGKSWEEPRSAPCNAVRLPQSRGLLRRSWGCAFTAPGSMRDAPASLRLQQQKS